MEMVFEKMIWVCGIISTFAAFWKTTLEQGLVAQVVRAADS